MRSARRNIWSSRSTATSWLDLGAHPRRDRRGAFFWSTMTMPAAARYRDRSSRSGWTVTEAENGQVAIESVTAARPDVIMLDLMMPEMDGFEFLEKLRGRPDWRDIPVVVITAKDLTDEDRNRLNGGVERRSSRKEPVTCCARCCASQPDVSRAANRRPRGAE